MRLQVRPRYFWVSAATRSKHGLTATQIATRPARFTTAWPSCGSARDGFGRPDPAARLKPLREFAESIKEDLETKEMVKLFVEDEISSGNWLNSARAALNAPASSKSAAMTEQV